jgi:hypothetical protein
MMLWRLMLGNCLAAFRMARYSCSVGSTAAWPTPAAAAAAIARLRTCVLSVCYPAAACLVLLPAAVW